MRGVGGPRENEIQHALRENKVGTLLKLYQNNVYLKVVK